MARLSRAEIFDPSEIVAVHTMARTAIFERLGIDGVACLKVVKDFGRAFKNVAGKSTSIERARSLKTGRKFYRAGV